MDDIVAYYGEIPAPSLRALVAIIEDRVVGVIGVSRHINAGVFFSDFKPELEPHLRSITIMRMIKRAMNFVHQYRGPVTAKAEHAEGCRILSRLGFTHLEGEWYGWLN